MLEYEVRPLTDKTWVPDHAEESRFKATWPDTLDLLEREIEWLGGTDVAIVLDVPASSIRNDGRLRADRNVGGRAVEVVFETPDFGTMVHRNARFIRGSATYHHLSKDHPKMPADWMHNVRAIALTLERLRDIERYGSGRSEQYLGYKALGAGTGEGIASGMTQSDAFGVIARAVNRPDLAEGATVVSAAIVKAARIMTHPDKHAGDRSQYNLVDQAVGVLERAGKVRS